MALCALLVLLLGETWVGITVHIANLRCAAGQDRGAANSDAHVEYLAQASGFVSAQLFFGTAHWPRSCCS